MASTLRTPTRPASGDAAASDAHPRRAPWSLIDRALAAAVALPLVLWTAAVATASHAWLAQSIPDDAYYYLEIGQRLARGEGPTFDGIHATNGFHPLWQAIVALLALPFSGDGLARATLLLSIGLVAIAAVLLARALEVRFGRRAALAGVAVALHAGGMQLIVNGMETPAVVCAAAVLITLIDRDVDQRRSLAVGVVCAAVVMARIDLLIGILVVPIGLGWWRDRTARLRWCAGFGAVVVPVFVVNLVAFRIPLSVSGTLKLHYASDLAASRGGWLSAGYREVVWQSLVDYGHLFSAAVATPGASLLSPGSSAVHWLGAALLVAGAVSFSGSIRHRGSRRGLELVLAALVAKTVVDLAVLPAWATGWYAGPFIVLASATAVAAVGQRLLADPPSWVRRAWAAMLVLLLVAPTGVPRTHLDRVDPTLWQGANDQVAAWLRAHPVDGRIGAYDAGLLGFSLDPTPVINLDGLVNDPDYARALIDGITPLESLRMNGVEFLVGRFADGDPRVPACADEVWRSKEPIAYQDSASPPTYVAMRVLDVRCAVA